MTKYEKELALHDWVVAHTAYSQNLEGTKVTDPIYGAEGVLLNGEAVCQGYAEAMKLFMDLTGIESDIVTGTSNKNGQTIPHAWNLVKLDDNEWYHLDATWDDPTPDDPGRVTYAYFNVNDGMIKEDHVIDANKTYPEARGTRYFYYADKKVNTEQEFTNYVDKLLADKVYSGEVYCGYTAEAETLGNVISNLMTKYQLNGTISVGISGNICTFSIELDK